MKRVVYIITLLLVFSLGWLSHNTFESFDPSLERAKSFVIGLPEKPTPADRIPENKIKVYPDKVILDIQNARWATFTPTHSMAPVFDVGSNVIQVIPQSSSEVKIGDIISYTWKDGTTIIHRVIQTGFDKQGWYAIVKGDNVPVPDAEKVRFSQVKKVVVAIVY